MMVLTAFYTSTAAVNLETFGAMALELMIAHCTSSAADLDTPSKMGVLAMEPTATAMWRPIALAMGARWSYE